MSSYSVKKPITVLMGILIVIVLGLFSITRLPLTLFPEINLPFVVTITTFEGRTPEEVESEVSKKIEATVSTIGNFKEVYSMSNEHFGISVITFAESSNMDSIVVELRELLNNINFADGVGNTRILRISPDMLPVMTVTLFRTYADDPTDEEALIRNTEWIQRDLLVTLQSIPGVADVRVRGEADVVLNVKLDQTIIDGYGMSHDDVLRVIEAQNVGGLIGVALDSGEIRMLYLGDKPSTLEDIANLPILNDGGNVILLSDLVQAGGISYINANTETYSKINGIQGIQVSFLKQADYGITEVTQNIIAKLDAMEAEAGLDAHYSILLDQGEYINQSINSVLQNIILGAILAIFILFIFLKDVKPTLIVGLAIPISVIAAFMLMYFTNISLNLISMGGLALGIGMLVDNSIVVIENIFRMISEGKSKTEAAILGAKQVASAITASTLTTMAVFLPIVFIEGLVADVFISMALTIAYSLGASLFIALTMVPAMASRMLNDRNDKPEGRFIHSLKKGYVKSVTYTLKHKWLTMGVVLILLASSVGLVAMKGFIFLPTSDEGTVSVTVTLASQVPFEQRALFADEMTADLLNMDDVENVSASINGRSLFGFGMISNASSGQLEMTINLAKNRKQSTKDNVMLIRALFADFDYSRVTGLDENQVIEVEVSEQNSTGSFGQAQGINIKVSGYNLQTLEQISNEITSIISTVPGVVKPDNGISKASDNVKITIDLEHAMAYGLTNRAVMDNIAYLYTNLNSLGSSSSLVVNIEGVDYTLDLPSEALTGGISFDAFGNYLNFLGGIMMFDAPTRSMIDRYIATSGQGVYVINAMLPGYVPGSPLQLVINPFLKVSGGELVMNPMSMDPTLLSLALAPLYTNDPETSIASVDRVTGFATINTDGSSRYLTVTAQVSEGYNITLVSQEVNRLVNQYLNSSAFTSFGNGYTVTFQGESEDILQAVFELSLAALVAILLVYMVMAIQFQSLVYPLIILGTIPLAFTGGMFALLITNSYLSLVSIMGFIILIGVVVNNGIVLIDYINKLRADGHQVLDAILLAGQTRIRPILMTALTTILALLTLALGFGEGAELLQPMAITAIGGLIYATLLTLVVIPTIYAAINRKTIRKEEAQHANHEG
jgi:HAE1 family hydrophobic/amphiphilic exporter-1